MKRFFPISFALLLVMASLGHVFAAAFCPRMLGHDCCLTKTSSSQHSSQSHQNMHGMAMDETANESMPMDGHDAHGMIMGDETLPSPSSETNEEFLPSTSEELAPANKLAPPIDACTHCMTHSGVQNAPVTSVSIPNQSNRYLGSVPLLVSGFLGRPSLSLAQIGLPREHAPPGGSAPRHILISIFQI